ncbi:MAG TPA: nucleotidyltransferase [Pyrinomonadaceae bacterium]|nr:nucleotidyltransferase [Pyrinomonadaceae bacterium]
MGIELATDFKEFLKSLNANGVRYLLIGGYAVGFHGYPRATNDLDVFVAKDSDNARRLVTCLEEFGFAAVAELSEELFIQEKSLVRMGIEPIKIEIVNFISGVEFEEAYKDKIIGVIDEIEVDLISLHHLKINKKASGNTKI